MTSKDSGAFSQGMMVSDPHKRSRLRNASIGVAVSGSDPLW